MEYLGINIDLSRDSLFDELGMKRLRESYMRDDECSRSSGLPLSRNNLVPIQSTHRDCMIIVLNTGCRTPPRSYLSEVV